MDVADHLQGHVQDRQADGGGRHRRHERLDEQLRDDTAAAGAERGAHGDLPHARRGARIDEDRDVHRDDQEQEADAELDRRA